MAKALRTASLIVGAVALGVATAGFGTALAAGASLSAAAAAAGTATLAGLSTAALGAIGTGLSVAAGLAAKKPSTTSGGSQTEFSADPFAGVPYLIGRTGTKGNIVFRQASDGWSLKDTPNDLCDLITIFSGAGPVDGYESFTSDKTPISFDGAGNAIGEFRDKMFQRRQLGACPEPSALTVQAGSSARPNGWTASHKLPGLAAAIWRLRYDSKQRFFQNGVPAPLWVIRGVKVYDPRLDSTYPGGSGSHRWDNEATWTWSDNPYLHALTWVIGRHQNGKRVMGLGAPIDQIIVSDFVEGANIANANGWTVGGVVYSRPDTKWNVLKQILQAGAGEPLRVGARIGCLINTPRVSLSTIRVADIIGDAKLTAMQPIRSRLNTVTPRYRSEANDWEIVPAAPIVVPAHIAEDGDERSKEIEYSLVQNVTQAASLARYDIENTREFGPVTMPLKPKWLNYKAGDCVTLEVPEAFGQKMLILKRTIDPASAVVTFEMRSETDGKHPFALGQTTTPPPTASVVPYDPAVPMPASDDWSVAVLTFGGEGVAAPAIVVTGRVGNPSADAVIFEYRPFRADALPEANWAGASLEAPTTTRKEFRGLAPDTQYEVGIRYRVRGTIGVRLILGAVTSGSGAVSWPVVSGPNRPDDNADVTGDHTSKDTNAVYGRPAKDIVDDISFSADTAAETLLRYQGQQLLIDARTLIDGKTYATVIQSVSDKADGYAAKVDVLGTSVPGGTGFQLNANVTMAGDDRSLSSRITSTEATLGTQSASIDTLYETLIDPTGATTRALFKMDVNGYVSGTVQTNNGKTSAFYIYADQFGVVSNVGGQPVKVFDIVNGELYANSLIVGRLRVGTGGTTAVPSIVSGSARVNSAGVGNWVTVLSTNVVMDAAGTITAQCALKQDYLDGQQEWADRILINGIPVFTVRGGRYNDSIALLGSLQLSAAGTYAVTVQFYGGSGVSVLDRTLVATAIYGTA